MNNFSILFRLENYKQYSVMFINISKKKLYSKIKRYFLSIRKC